MSKIKEVPEFVPDQQSDQRIKNVIDHLNTNFNHKIRLEDLAAVALLSPYHLLRVFKKCVGLTPREYLLRLRIEKTKQLLAQGYHLPEIVGMTGFSDRNHLIRSFRKVMGQSPAMFLQRMADQ
ncbi:MAG TPA: AraC family transcriptional regulator [Puia sp.]|nr:AraC family transcriptional regulator [Puia sp.]